jgi:uncharacterized OB-fold protein
MSAGQCPEPPVATPETARFWAAAAAGRLELPYCTRCQRWFFYPRSFCPACDSDDVWWRPVSGRAWLASYVVVQAAKPPYIVALIQLEEGPRLMSTLVGVDPSGPPLALGSELRAEFVAREGASFPVFRPSRSGS